MRPKSRVGSLWRPSSCVQAAAHAHVQPLQPISSLPESWAGGVSSLDGQFHVVRTLVLLQCRACLICDPQGLFCQVQSIKLKAGAPVLTHTYWALDVKSRFRCPFLVIAWKQCGWGIGAAQSSRLCAAVQFQELSEAQSPFLTGHYLKRPSEERFCHIPQHSF